MRRFVLASRGLQPETSDRTTLPMDEFIWENGYDRIIAQPQHRLLHRLWRHYYGANAELELSGAGLLQLNRDINAVLPDCLERPTVVAFLHRLSRLCDQAYQRKLTLCVIAG